MATHDPASRSSTPRSPDSDLRTDLDAALRTRAELGPEYEAELVESFLEKLDRNVERRVRRQVAEQQVQVARGHRPPGAGSGRSEFWERFAVAVVSLVLAVPLTAIAVVNAGLVGLVVCWAGVVGVNAVHGLAPGTRRRTRADRPDEEWRDEKWG
ncbi:hypothetical protein ADL22_14080 [Streptomyces sp. NRRL F-4489]|uniref:hypothetical protein n=1 Tax=Streptomyces sp. NRRL F-4489 TaxID=1609095 RepID=UPI0007468BD2|nr:hypothetical protein [Streptomyces sp. NRRL F-4489]KUL42626.1 hypothetical protein ADL22_14080 [Streptomyces sp. NRRL F-4489]